MPVKKFKIKLDLFSNIFIFFFFPMFKTSFSNFYLPIFPLIYILRKTLT